MNVATLTIEMAANVARLQQDMSKAASTVDGAMGKIRKSADMAMVALGAIGVGLSVAGLTNWVRSGINAADTTSKLAQKTGLLAKEVAGLQLAFDQGGAGEKMQEALAKMAKEAANNNVAFKAMGLQVTDSSGKIKSTRDLVGEVAGKFASYSDGVEKTALAQQIFGKSGADLIPVLNGGVEALDEYDRKAQALGLTLDDQTTKSAEAFNDQLDLLSQRTEGVARQLATELLPVLTQISSAMADGATNSGSMSTAGRVLSTVIETVTVLAANTAYVFRAIGNEIGGMFAQADRLLSLDFQGFAEIRRMMVEDGKIARAEIDSYSASILNANKVAASLKGASDYDEPRFRRAMAAAEQEKTVAPTVLAVASAKAKSAKASSANTEALKKEAEAQRALQQAIETEAKFRQVIIDDELKLQQIRDDRIQTAAEMLTSIEQETALLGLSNTEREKAVALMSLERAGVVAGTEAYAAYADQISQAIDAKAGKQAAIDLASDQAKAYEDAIKKQQDENDKFWSSVDSTAHDVFVSVANEGEDASKRIGKTLKAAVLDMLYQMTVKKWIFQISGSFSGGGGGSGTNWIDLAQQAYSAYSGGSATSAGIAAGAGTVNTTSLSGIASASAGSTGVAGGTTVAASTGTASSTMAAGGYTGYGYLGYAALIAAAVMVAENLYEKGYTRAALGVGNKTQFEYGNGNFTSAGQNEGQTPVYTYSPEAANRRIGEAIGLNDKWADILSGTTRMAALFGRKLSEYGFEAIVNGSETAVRGYEKYKGGLFRSNKTTYSEVNNADSKVVAAQIASWAEANRSMARALGYSEEALDSYTGKVRINFKGAKTAAEIAERYAEAQEKLQFEMLKAASGARLSKEAFKDMMADVQASIQNAGVSAQGIGDILAQGAIGRLTQAQVGEQLSEVIIGGIYNTIAQNAMAPVAEVFMSNIITPIFTAIMAGVPISQAVSQAAIDQVVATAQNAAEALNAILADPGFQTAISSIEGAISSVSRISVSSARHVRAYGSAVNASAQAAQAAAQERYGLETRLLTLLNETAKLRERERNALSAGNRSLFDRIVAIEDSKTAMDSALEAFNSAIDKQIEVATDLESTLNDLFSMLRSNVRELRGEVEQTSTMQGAAAVAMIRQAAASGVLPDSDSLGDAIASARAMVESAQYASRFERDRAYLTLSNDLAALGSAVQPQLSAAERSVIELGELKQTQQDAYNALLGIDNSVLTVADAVNALNASMAVYSAAIAAGRGIPVASSAPKAGAAFANGGAFSGGIVKRPTFFDMGLMGEAGGEGILPLANVGGRLGVNAAGAGSDPEVRRLLKELVDRMDKVEASTRKTADESREIRVFADRADKLGIAQRRENVF